MYRVLGFEQGRDILRYIRMDCIRGGMGFIGLTNTI